MRQSNIDLTIAKDAKGHISPALNIKGRITFVKDEIKLGEGDKHVNYEFHNSTQLKEVLKLIDEIENKNYVDYAKPKEETKVDANETKIKNLKDSLCAIVGDCKS